MKRKLIMEFERVPATDYCKGCFFYTDDVLCPEVYCVEDEIIFKKTGERIEGDDDE